MSEQTTPSTSSRTIERALENIGDRPTLAALLGVEVADLNRWILGKQIPPHEIFLRALDLAFRGTLPVAPTADVKDQVPGRRLWAGGTPAKGRRTEEI
jgi:DNA-binding transcriptional regulator YdaS (Cro superfamily)